MRSAAASAALFFLVAPAVAETPATPPLLPAERRVEVDPLSPPWNAVAKLQTNTATRCTGTLIGPATVLTAAHCLYNPRTRTFLRPASLHVLFGYRRGSYRWHGQVLRYVIGEGFGGSGALRRPSADWARLELVAPVPPTIAPLPVASVSPPSGTAVALPGYGRDRTELLTADISCHITGQVEIRGERLLAHDCSTTRGTSGGPLLTQRDQRWEAVGINIGVAAASNIALPLAYFGDGH